MNRSSALTAMTYVLRKRCFLILTLAFAFLSDIVVVPDSAHAQAVSVTTIENAAGDSVLTSFEDGGFAAFGEFGVGTIPAEGMDTSMMWYPAKAAFRAGRMTSNRWDDVHIGKHSVAIGGNTEASAESGAQPGHSVVCG